MIGHWSTHEMVSQIGGSALGADVAFNKVSTDTRTVEAGDLFLALVGENFDGHQFIEQALEKGAVAVCISDTNCLPEGASAWRVDDTRIALGQMGALNRSRFNGRVLAVTGSAGKTTVKEMMAAMCAAQAETLFTQGNLNNDLGAPMTLLRLTESHQFAVIELGASAIGEIDYTVQLTQPHVAILNNALGAHLEGFGSLQGVVTAKGEIFNTLDKNGVAIINADDYHASVWLDRVAGRCQVRTFSVEKDAQATAFGQNLVQNEAGGFDFLARVGANEYQVSLSVLGRHNVANALAAMNALDALGALNDTAVNALNAFQAVKGRMRSYRVGSSLIIDDSYNANPDAVKVAADVLATFEGPRAFVLGDMAEVGESEIEAHQATGRYMAELGVEAFFTCGKLSAHALDAYVEAMQIEGKPYEHASAFYEREELAEALRQWCVTSPTHAWTLLIKGSRSAKMDEVVTTLTQPTNEQ